MRLNLDISGSTKNDNYRAWWLVLLSTKESGQGWPFFLFSLLLSLANYYIISQL